MNRSELEGALYTFHNERIEENRRVIEEYHRRTGEFPAQMFILKPGTQHHMKELHDEGNLLFNTVHYVNIEEIERVTTHACILINTTWKNILKLCENNVDFTEVAFPKADDLKKCIMIGFPKG